MAHAVLVSYAAGSEFGFYCVVIFNDLVFQTLFRPQLSGSIGTDSAGGNTHGDSRDLCAFSQRQDG